MSGVQELFELGYCDGLERGVWWVVVKGLIVIAGGCVSGEIRLTQLQF